MESTLAEEIEAVGNDGWDDEPQSRDAALQTAYAKAMRKSANTLRGYKGDLNVFSRWCAQYGYTPVPTTPNVLAQFLAEKSRECAPGRSTLYAHNSMVRWVSAIDHYHGMHLHRLPGRSKKVQDLLKELQRSNPLGKEREPFLGDDIVRIIDSIDFETWPKAVRSFRDAAIFLVGFGGGYRRSELSNMTRRDLQFGSDGVTIRLPKSKTDQQGLGRFGGIARGPSPRYCAPCAVGRWLLLVNASESGDQDLRKVAKRLNAKRDKKHICTTQLRTDSLAPDAPVFRSVLRKFVISPRKISGDDINRAIQHHSVPLGYSAKDYGAHSLRAGFVTFALDNGASILEVMRQTGHKSSEMLLRYYRNRRPLASNGANYVTLGAVAQNLGPADPLWLPPRHTNRRKTKAPRKETKRKSKKSTHAGDKKQRKER